MFGTHAVLTYSGLRERSPEFWAGLRRLLVIAVDLRMGNLGRRRHLRATLLVSTVAALVFVLLVPTPVSAKDTAISGTVTDSTGLVLPGVAAEARNLAVGGQVQVVSTDGSGMFMITVAQPGAYEVTFTLPGFATMREVVEINAGATVTLDAALSVRFQEQMVVVGSRAQPRSVTASAVPVDAISSRDFLSQGDIDLTNQLRTVVPSFNVGTQPISDTASIVKPINLRNLAPDHTLILVNGKRRHRAAVITWLGNGVADGAQGPDISVIPAIALRQVEMLRDGAATQYGSETPSRGS